MISVFCQNHGHSHYPGANRYSTPDGDVEEGEKEKLQQNGEASNLAPGKVDAGEGELMLSPAQTPQVREGPSTEEEEDTFIRLPFYCISNWVFINPESHRDTRGDGAYPS